MRRAAKRAVNRPLVPRRQLTFLHVETARIVSAAVDSVSGMECLRGLHLEQVGRRIAHELERVAAVDEGEAFLGKPLQHA